MGLLLYCTIIFAISSIVIIECNLIHDTVPTTSSLLTLFNKAEDVPEPKVLGYIPIIPLKLPISAITHKVYPASLTITTPQIMDTPRIEPIPNKSSDLIAEIPNVELFWEPSEDQVNYPRQPEPKLTDQEIKDLKSARSIANRVGECDTDSLNKCDIFKLAGGIVCSNTSVEVVCDNLDLTPCTDLVNDACYDFTNADGVFCSEGGCAQYK